MTGAGIDVAHQTLGVVLRSEEQAGKAQEFAPTARAHLARVKGLKAARVERVCLEARGCSHLDRALARDTAGLALRVVNPKAAKPFTEARLTRTKTDAVEAAVRAQLARPMPFDPGHRPHTPKPWRGGPVSLVWRPSTGPRARRRTSSLR
jgi:transposase